MVTEPMALWWKTLHLQYYDPAELINYSKDNEMKIFKIMTSKRARVLQDPKQDIKFKLISQFSAYTQYAVLYTTTL